MASAPADAVVLRPPPPGRATDVEAATREALRFPLDGQPLEALARGATRATIVVEPPALPLGSVRATSAARDRGGDRRLEELGIPTGTRRCSSPAGWRAGRAVRSSQRS